MSNRYFSAFSFALLTCLHPFSSSVNFEDPNVNILLPLFFCIHGNHDDPSGVSFLCSLCSVIPSYILCAHSVSCFLRLHFLLLTLPLFSGSSLCSLFPQFGRRAALDLLAASNLVNYFGKVYVLQDARKRVERERDRERETEGEMDRTILSSSFLCWAVFLSSCLSSVILPFFPTHPFPS